MQALVILLILMALGGEAAPVPENGYPVPPEPPPFPPPLIPDENGFIPAVLPIPNGLEPPVPPGPVDRPIPPDMPDAEWLAGIDGIVSDIPKQDAFWLVTQGSTASELATALLPANANTGANRLRLIKCITAVPWNKEKYAADAGRGTWGTLYDVDGVNLSSAWMPRHPSAMQALANRQNPLRGIDDQGAQVGTGGYYGLLWIPNFTATANALVCNGSGQNPPPWLMTRLEG